MKNAGPVITLILAIVTLIAFGWLLNNMWTDRHIFGVAFPFLFPTHPYALELTMADGSIIHWGPENYVDCETAKSKSLEIRHILSIEAECVALAHLPADVELKHWGSVNP